MNQIFIASALFLTLVLSNFAAAFGQTALPISLKSPLIERFRNVLDKFFAEQMPKYKVPGAFRLC
jgi:hypothetical protein